MGRLCADERGGRRLLLARMGYGVLPAQWWCSAGTCYTVLLIAVSERDAAYALACFLCLTLAQLCNVLHDLIGLNANIEA